MMEGARKMLVALRTPSPLTNPTPCPAAGLFLSSFMPRRLSYPSRDKKKNQRTECPSFTNFLSRGSRETCCIPRILRACRFFGSWGPDSGDIPEEPPTRLPSRPARPPRRPFGPDICTSCNFRHREAAGGRPKAPRPASKNPKRPHHTLGPRSTSWGR